MPPPRSSSELMVQWEAPSPADSNGLVLGYSLRYRLRGYRDVNWYYRNVSKATQHRSTAPPNYFRFFVIYINKYNTVL